MSSSESKVPLVKRLDPAHPLLPESGRQNVLITSALPYVNNVPHLGNIIGCVLSADVYARYRRQRGDNVIYICGTDEYGTATETKALQEGLTPKEICDKYHAIHRDVYDWFQIKFDLFGRTSTPQQTDIAQDIFHKLDENAFISQDSVQQLLCTHCNRYLADRYIEGTCPLCQYEGARGDQCDNCAKLLNANQLINPKCTVCRQPNPVQKTEEHLFIDLEKLQPILKEWLERGTVKLDKNAEGITYTWLNQGLKARCITRDLTWGTPVPKKGFEKKVFYVWYDAPIGYLSITKCYTPEWERWWKNPDDVSLYMFMGKDNVPFHTVLFPSSLLGTKENWTMLNQISTTEYLMFEGQQFSKSRGVGVFGNQVKDTGFSPDIWRYALLANRPETSDSSFSWVDLMTKNNSELLANVGNFTNRTLKFLWDKYVEVNDGVKINGVLPQLSGTLNEHDLAVIHEMDSLLKTFIAEMNDIKIREGLRLVCEMSHVGNKYLQDTKPWELFKNDRVRCDVVVTLSLHILYVVSTALAPFLPGLASKILQSMAVISAEDAAHLECHPFIPSDFAAAQFPFPFLTHGHVINEPPVIPFVEKIDKVPGMPSASSSSSSSSPSSSSSAVSGEKKAVAVKKEKVQKPQQEKVKEAESPERAALIEEMKNQRILVKQLEKEKADPSTIQAAKDKLEALQASLSKDKERAPKEPREKKANPKKIEGEGEGKWALDIRVGKIVSVEEHPEAESLFILRIDVGENEPRQVCAGLRGKYESGSLLEKHVLVVCNLKTSKLRGKDSQGMVLAASDESTTSVIVPSSHANLGDRVVPIGVPSPSEYPKDITKATFDKFSLSISEGKAHWTHLAGAKPTLLTLENSANSLVFDPNRPVLEGAKIK